MATGRVSFVTPPTSESGDSSPASSVVDLDETSPQLVAAREVLSNLAHLVIAPERVTFVRELSFAGHYLVRLAKLDESSHPRDVTVKEPFLKDEGDTILKIWQGLKHQNVLELLGFYLDPQSGIAQLISPYLINGNILDYMKQSQVGIDRRLRFVRDLTAGLDYLHSLTPPIRHGNLHPRNILVDDNLNAVLSGFSLAVGCDISGDRSGLRTEEILRGSLRYQGPELFVTDIPNYSPSSDIWAWGCTAFEILVGKKPYVDLDKEVQVFFAILRERKTPGEADLILDLVPNPAQPEYASTLRLLHSYLPLCWQYEPRKRPPISVILQQAFVFSTENDAEDSVEAVLKELAHFLIPPNCLHIFERPPLGIGNFGQVVLGTLDGATAAPKEVAVKKLKVEGNRGDRIRLIKRLARELNVWAIVKHPNVLQLIGYCLDEKYESPLLVSELMINGSVLNYVQRYKPDLETRIGFVRGITAGLACLHNFDPPICHADLKPANVLVDLHMNAVLCDFGLASFVGNSGASPGLITSTIPRGTPRYMSPELTLDEDSKHTLESDVWAWACTVFEILTGSIPYAKAIRAESIIVSMIANKPPGETDLLVPSEFEGAKPKSTVVLQLLRSTLPQCWDFDPQNRPSICTLLSHLSNPPSQPEAPTQVEEAVGLDGIQEEAKLVDELESPSGECAPNNGAQRDEQIFQINPHPQDETIPDENMDTGQSEPAAKEASDGEEPGKEDHRDSIVDRDSEGTQHASNRSSLNLSIHPLNVFKLIAVIACVSVCGNIYFLLRKDDTSPLRNQESMYQDSQHREF